MSLIQQIRDSVQQSETKSAFRSFKDLHKEFPAEHTDHQRPVNFIDLSRICKEAKRAGLEPYSKDFHECGIWFRIR